MGLRVEEEAGTWVQTAARYLWLQSSGGNEDHKHKANKYQKPPGQLTTHWMREMEVFYFREHIF